MRIDVNVAQWVDGAEAAERRSVDAERRNQRIARETGQPTLPTASLDWDAFSVSGEPPGALTPTVAHETLTTAANRRRWARLKAYRTALSGLARAIRAA